ncbi:MAG TPA: TonB-dependent receptor [Rubrivivax sp.]|nr:TonB-dependent receptor [Rubrivivax sp.]
MNRRDFHGNLAGAALALMTPGHARAQAAPVEGQSYVRLQNAAPLLLPTPDKKVDVIEFFWYGCPHCNAFEPMLSNWADRLAADVSFRRVHVGFGPVHQVHQKLYYALEETGRHKSSPFWTANLRLGHRLSRQVQFSLDVLNLFDRQANDIEYWYDSQLRGETAASFDRHVHPTEPRTLRLTLSHRF